LVDFGETNLNLKEELEEFERAFEKDEVVELAISCVILRINFTKPLQLWD